MNIVVNGSKIDVELSFRLPGDKSIAHRALIIGSLPKGEYRISNFPGNLDCLATLQCMQKLGVTIDEYENNLVVKSPGYKAFNKTPGLIDAKNSGTTARLILGLLSGCGIHAVVDGDASLRKRPMRRVTEPLEFMGAGFEAPQNLLPIKTHSNSKLNGIEYALPVPSAQVKSCVLIAGFLAKGTTTILEKIKSRDHTEKLFKYLGAEIELNKNIISIRNSELISKNINIPGDISSAAFLIACALLSNNCEITIEDVLLNASRRSFLDILKSMNANLEYRVNRVENGEEVGYIKAGSSNLKCTEISSELIPGIIDEIPVLAVLAAFSEGTTRICGVQELKYKESDRISAILSNFRSAEIEAEYLDDNLIIYGNNIVLNGLINIKSYNDHRIALAFLALGARNLGDTIIENWECTDISFPNSLRYFKELLNIDTCM